MSFFVFIFLFFRFIFFHFVFVCSKLAPVLTLWLIFAEHNFLSCLVLAEYIAIDGLATLINGRATPATGMEAPLCTFGNRRI